MKFTTNRTRAITAMALILFISTLTLMTNISVKAQDDQPHGGAPQLNAWATSPPPGVTPSVTVTSTAFMSFRPDPVGLDQTILVNIWLEPATHYNRYRSGYSVTLTKPDGTTDTVGPVNSYQGDTTAWFEYTVDQIGTWKVKFTADGNYFPAGYYTRDGKIFNTSVTGSTFLNTAFYQGDSTEEQSLIVQQEPVLSWPPAPLPTDYWTRPIPIENREWWVIGGHYPFTGMGGGSDWPADTNVYASNYKSTPYVQAPNTAHIVWKRQGALAGVVGGQYGQRSYGPGEGTYAGTPTIIFQGRCYQTVTKVTPTTINGTSQSWPISVWQCYDLRTGQVYWEIPGVTAPSYVVYNSVPPSVPGAQQTGQATGGQTGNFHLIAISGGRLIKYHPFTGNPELNISIPVSSGTLYNEPNVLSVQTLGSGASTTYRLINWSVLGTDTNFTNRISSNTTWPFSSLGTCDFESGIAVATGSISPAGAGHSLGQFIMGANLVTGSLLWNVTTSDIFFSTSTGVADHGKYVVRMLGGWWDAWDLFSGKFLWKSEMPAYPWGDFGAYNIASYGGLWYDLSYDGIYAFSWEDGKIVWHFNPAYPGYEAAFSSYPYFTNPIVADGKLFVANGEHSPTEPLMRGWKLHCLNAMTGEPIWNITGGGTVGGMADGYITFDNRYDGFMYVFGKGKSATTITAPETTVTKGTALLIQGTVLDQSPAQAGTPCVSKESMTTYMEYLHMQKPVDGIYHNVTVTGVPVQLLAIDSSGTVIDLDIVTSDVSGSFGTSWTPTNEGVYRITATFVGDDSYGSSWAETRVSVGPAPETPTPPEQPQPIDNTMTIVATGIAIIIAIAIATIVLLRKRP